MTPNLDILGNNRNTNTPQLNIFPNDLKTLSCEECGGIVFAEGMIIKTVSPLLTGNGKEGMLPIPAFYCVKCSTPVEKYLPDELKKKSVIVNSKN